MARQFRLGKSFKCSCGQVHEIPVRNLYYHDDAVEKTGDILTEALGGQPPAKSIVVADERTQQICGQRDKEKEGGWSRCRRADRGGK